MAIWVDKVNNLVIAIRKCKYCGSELMFAFSPRAITTEKYIKVMCSDCAFENLIPLEVLDGSKLGK